MKFLAVTLAGLIALIQYPLWLGKGGWLRVWELDRQLLSQQTTNKRLAARNEALDAEVRDLQTGLYAVEERARYDLGMVRPDEYFIHYNEARAQQPKLKQPDASSSTRSASRGDAPVTAPYLAARR